MTKTTTLYFRPGACALAPHIVLNWIGEPYSAIKAPRDNSFKLVNPTGAVPVLETPEGNTLTQCGAILQYLAERAGRTELIGGAENWQRAQVAKWTSFFTGDFHPAFFPMFVPQRYTADVSELALENVKTAALVLVQSGLDTIESRLSQSDVFVGSDYTIADAYAVPMLRWSKSLFGSKFEHWPATKAFYEIICSDPGVVKAMEAHDILP